MAHLSEQHRKLAALVGTWVGDDTMHPAPWSPEGGTGTTTYTGRLALGGLFVVGDDGQARPGHDDYLAHKVFGWDPATGDYTFYLVDSIGQNPPAAARGAWEGDTVTFEQPLPHGRMRYRYTFDGEGRYTFQMAFSPDGAAWRPLIDGIYRRQ